LRQKTKPVTVANRKLIIPAGAAFGTGEHATTAMCLRLLEKLARTGLSRFSMIDLGTGTGILAIAAKVLGAKSVIAIDNDPVAISTAKENARSNRIRGIEFRVSDVRNWTMTRRTDVLTANLFSELLVEILPKLRGARSLILSGLLREQEGDVRRALTQNRIRLVEVRRRGKWVAMLAASR
ncbi:MAG TPA: 50S ribosomal protein L11 methyltransferase, partial [Chthoniobacterales bacterium]|nr:50S ribosomal protein L11 methyltransferase [Chthoniobacterales bacterium]